MTQTGSLLHGFPNGPPLTAPWDVSDPSLYLANTGDSARTQFFALKEELLLRPLPALPKGLEAWLCLVGKKKLFSLQC